MRCPDSFTVFGPLESSCCCWLLLLFLPLPPPPLPLLYLRARRARRARRASRASRVSLVPLVSLLLFLSSSMLLSQASGTQPTSATQASLSLSACIPPSSLLSLAGFCSLPPT
ncbi:hypothetical protein F4859DRAFT_499182 [Xylaria cf. heliscus]|nr:hypothetical protein F4859DRAFT_499182 [Xylaria cf. heliscus]